MPLIAALPVFVARLASRPGRAGAVALLSLTLSLWALPARAAPTTAPTAAPLTAQDLSVLELAFDALKRGDYAGAPRYISMVKSEIGRDLLIWRLAVHTRVDLDFDQIVQLADKYPDWPRMNRLLAQAERAMDANLRPEQIVQWFAGREPLTGEGMIRLGVALLEQGEAGYGTRWIRRAWVDFDFADHEQDRILDRFGGLIDRGSHLSRLDRLLWERKFTLAQRLLPLLTNAERAYAEARIGLVRGREDPKTIDRMLPKDYRNDPGLLFDRAYAMRRHGEASDAWPFIIDAKAATQPLPYPDLWWTESHIQARKAHRAQDYQHAYELARDHRLDSGVGFADAEFLAGWLALRYLDEPVEALAHFRLLGSRVGSPISKARAHYWSGRAAEAAGLDAEATTEYQAAAAFPYTYYGQLAMVHPRVDKQRLVLPSLSPDRAGTKEAFESRPAIQAIRIAHALDQDWVMRVFFRHVAESSRRAEDFALLGDLAHALGRTDLAVRVGKKGLSQRVLLLEHAYPLVSLPTSAGAGALPEKALVLGLSRQESEFNPKVVSHAGARGLMQLMPGTARITARKHGLTYNRARLTTDPVYNMTIGMAHLADLLERFEGSYIMSIAAYNAGAGRVDQWVEQYGDPRLPGVDAIDWVESIPFSETRNYVQRVLENVQVYRTRLAGNAQPVGIESDLKRFVSLAPSGLTPPSALEGTTRQAQNP
ncbi:MAG: lytic transglycosylase domain-containing protein [Pseudomonadota bacterium]